MKYKINKLLFVILIVLLCVCFLPEEEPAHFTISFITTLDSLSLSNLFIEAQLYDKNGKTKLFEIDSSEFYLELTGQTSFIGNQKSVPITKDFEFYDNPLSFNITLHSSTLDTICYGSIQIDLRLGSDVNKILIYFAKKYNLNEPNLMKFISDNQTAHGKFLYKSFGVFYSDTQNVATDSLFIIYRKYVSQRFKWKQNRQIIIVTIEKLGADRDELFENNNINSISDD